jgi:hypothetical protein
LGCSWGGSNGLLITHFLHSIENSYLPKSENPKLYSGRTQGFYLEVLLGGSVQGYFPLRLNRVSAERDAHAYCGMEAMRPLGNYATLLRDR